MRILHTSDWHIGRTFHTHSTLDHLGVVLAALVDVVREREVDVVAVAGDVFDTAVPSADAYRVLSAALRGIREAGAQIVMTSGNHDSATRLGFQSEWLGAAGIHIATDEAQLDRPVLIDDAHGPVAFYGIPYLEPALIRHRHPEIELRTHEQALRFATDRIRTDAAARKVRSVVLSHCFAAGVAASDVERDISAGGLDLVPVEVFDGVDYTALGHIHSRAELRPSVRYSGAPLHYSFSEAGKPRGAWLVELDATGLADIEWIDLPVPRRLVELTADLEVLLTDELYAENEGDWVSAILTDRVRPMDGMRRLRTRFPHAVALEHRPTITAETASTSYSERIRTRSDLEVVDGFIEFVRNGVGPTEPERALLAEVLAENERAGA